MEINSEVKSLLSLLDDPDENIYTNVFNRLCEYGPAIIPSLEKEWEHNLDDKIQERLETLIHTIQFDTLKADLKIWKLNDSKHLLDGLLIVNRFLYPDSDSKKITEQIELLKKSIWMELNYQLTPLEQVKVFNTIFYKYGKYEANIDKLHDPRNNFIEQVMQTKKGNPIGLGLLYLVLAQQLRMPLYGVCLKGYFVLCFIDTEIWNSDPSMINSKDIIFYINPYNKGAVFNLSEIMAYLRRTPEPKDKFFYPANNIEIITELLTTIASDYAIQGEQEKVNEVLELRKLLA